MMTKQNCIDFPDAQSYKSSAPHTWGDWMAAGRLLAVREMRAVKALVKIWIMRYSTRRVLRELDTHQLADIGVTPEQARTEALKAFWQA